MYNSCNNVDIIYLNKGYMFINVVVVSEIHGVGGGDVLSVRLLVIEHNIICFKNPSFNIHRPGIEF